MEFEQIYELYFKDVFLYLRSLSATAQTAEEIAQEAFVKAWKSIESYDGTKDIRAWLFTIAKNTYYTHCRREKFYADYERNENQSETSVEFVQMLADKERAFSIHKFLHDIK